MSHHHTHQHEPVAIPIPPERSDSNQTSTDSPPSPVRHDGIIPAVIDYLNHPTEKKKHRIYALVAAIIFNAILYGGFILYDKYA
jgi:hypothetical protein